MIPLYATEWMALGILGLAITGVIAALDIMASRFRKGLKRGTLSNVGFAIVISTSFFFGALTWFESFRNHIPPWQSWIGILLGCIALVGIAVACGKLQSMMAAASGLARTLSCIGLATLLSLPFFSGSNSPAGRGSVPASLEGGKDRPNIALITVDALAAGHLMPYGSLRPTSPNVSAFASNAIVFDQFHANSNFTTTAVASVLTGELPWTHRAFQLPARPISSAIADSLPARMHEAGYETAYFGSNPWAGARRMGFSAYFDEQYSDLDWVFGPCLDALAGLLPYLCASAGNPLVNVSYAAAVRVAGALGIIRITPHSNLEQFVATVNCWTARPKHAPVFMWVHFFPPHDPYAAPKPWLGQYDHSGAARTATSSHPQYLFDFSSEAASRVQTLEARYDESILYMDYYFGRLISDIRRNLGPNTVIFLTADHGESFEHGYGGHSGIMLYEDLIHIPLLVELPHAVAAPQRRNDLATQIDLAPTITSLAGMPPFSNWTGRSLFAVQDAGEPHTEFSMNFEENNTRGRLTTGSIAAMRANWKLVRFFGKPRYPHMPALQTQLFDLQADPHEMVNLAAERPDIVEPLSSQIDAQLVIHGGALGE